MALKGTNQELGRPYNRRLVLECVRLHGPIARGQIAQRIGLTVQTVSNIVRELEDTHYLVSLRDEPKGRGLPPTRLRINPEGGFAIGVHVTPFGVAAGLIDLDGTVLESVARPIANATPDQAFAIVGELLPMLAGRRPRARILGIGLVLPGPFGVESMSFVGSTTMSGWEGVPILDRLSEAAGLPAFIETDVAAAALGEQLYGVGKEFADYYHLYFGVGLGGALIHDGRLIRGARGNAGEIGHMPVVPGGEACPCGNRGCLERYVSLDALQRAGVGEAEWVEAIAPIFRNLIATIENLYDPETVVLGGLASPALLERLAGLAEKLPNSISVRRDRRTPRVMVARGGEHSVLRGAAALAVSGALSPRYGALFGSDREQPDGGEIAA